MFFLYNILTNCAKHSIKFAGNFNPKLKLFSEGRKHSFEQLKQIDTSKRKVIWIHCASLGEFEQGRPIIEALHENPENFILLTFFSPSGYEVRKNYDKAHHIMYLPLDTASNAKEFIALAKPNLAIFVKYEFWPNYLKELKKQRVQTLLISGIFREKHVFFKWYGGFMRDALKSFEHFFVQDERSKRLLNKLNIQDITISGDTRFDRVSQILQQDNSLDFLDSFKGQNKCVVYGSIWKDDMPIISNYINTSNNNVKHIIAPHHVDKETVDILKSDIKNKNVLLYSELEDKKIEDYDVLIVNTIGLLTKIYAYANIAYVGGGFKTGLHNTLEPAVFGIPVVIGNMYGKFKEAVDLVDRGGIISIDKHSSEFDAIVASYISDDKRAKNTGAICSNYIKDNKGATETILNYLK